MTSSADVTADSTLVMSGSKYEEVERGSGVLSVEGGS